MTKKLIIAAVASALAGSALAAPYGTPYALSAVHADFQAQLEQVAEMPGEIGAAARAAADLMGPHNAAQERLVLPLLGVADAASTGRRAKVSDLPGRESLTVDLSQLHEGDVDLVTALVELYSVAEGQEHDIARLAERMIWHETGDVDLLYPTVLLVEAAIRAQAASMGPTTIHVGPGPLYGEQPTPMMGAGDPHGSGAHN